jgi:hypothetical protein
LLCRKLCACWITVSSSRLCRKCELTRQFCLLSLTRHCISVSSAIQGQTNFVVTTGNNPNYPNPPAWGISYHVNGKESPVIVVTRGIEVTFDIRAGTTHPLYITDSITGGARPGHKVYAGGEQATGTAASPFILKWTPNGTTPDTVYYQCFTHERLGWKILVTGAGASSALSSFASIFRHILFAIGASIATLSIF